MIRLNDITVLSYGARCHPAIRTGAPSDPCRQQSGASQVSYPDGTHGRS